MESVEDAALRDSTPWATNRDMAREFERGRATAQRELAAARADRDHFGRLLNAALAERDELHASVVEMTHHAERRQVKLDAARARITALESAAADVYAQLDRYKKRETAPRHLAGLLGLPDPRQDDDR